ncbi:MAG TPA: HAMP domain-containing sensor histidine kinase [Candidatus Omnitrophota bacterium]|nr:HAMP domain-containing sensor histidine kinase [Candidatus Omnitrophota bacterium]HPS37216.1 HAMP domain-containing sensor histidine kinase [Candidatus Omnitrophota bacterium]
MTASEKPYQAAHEIGRIYDAITDRKVLVDFFLTTVLQFIPARAGYLFLAGKNKDLWLEASTPVAQQAPAGMAAEAASAFRTGKPVAGGRRLFLPLVVRNASLGLACFERGEDLPAFGSKDVELGFDLAAQFAGALKNSFLFEENLKMERLAAVGQAMAMVVHEIKNIMQVARLSDELTRDGFREKNERFIEKGLSKMTKALRGIDGFVFEMLSLTKDYELAAQKINLPALLLELQNDMDDRAQQLRVRLDFRAPLDFPEVEGDPRALYRALLNLVKNAMEAFAKDAPGACVKILARIKDAEQYELIVEDNAQGMTEEVRARLFEAFFSTKGKEGTGLGLMVVARTVKMHRGTVEVKSKPGEGSRFILTLPRAFPA